MLAELWSPCDSSWQGLFVVPQASHAALAVPERLQPRLVCTIDVRCPHRSPQARQLRPAQQVKDDKRAACATTGYLSSARDRGRLATLSAAANCTTPARALRQSVRKVQASTADVNSAVDDVTTAVEIVRCAFPCLTSGAHRFRQLCPHSRPRRRQAKPRQETQVESGVTGRACRTRDASSARASCSAQGSRSVVEAGESCPRKVTLEGRRHDFECVRTASWRA